MAAGKQAFSGKSNDIRGFAGLPNFSGSDGQKPGMRQIRRFSWFWKLPPISADPAKSGVDLLLLNSARKMHSISAVGR